MKRRLGNRSILILVLLTAWLTSGLYVVRGNEAAVVRVLGAVQRGDDGSVLARASGLYLTLPWPLATVDLVNLNEIRTLLVGGADVLPENAGAFLQVADNAARTQFVSGDKNILHVTLNVHYRVSPQAVGDWLYGSVDPEQRLRDLAESVLADVVVRCGVDFLHTLGHGEVRAAVLEQLKRAVEKTPLGVEIDDVTLVGITPPVRVKSDFVDVMNARADRETQINHALAYAEQREAATKATLQTTQDAAEQYRGKARERALAEASVVASLERALSEADGDPATVRRQYLERQHLNLLHEVLPGIRRIVVAPSSKDGGVNLGIEKNAL